MAKGTKYDQQFKENAVRYRMDHPELTLKKASENLGISDSTLKTWLQAAKEHEGCVPTRGSGNYSSDEAKEIARLQRELRDTKYPLEILKSHQYPGKMTESVYTATAEYIVEVEQRSVKHRVSVSGVLKRLGVSRSGYNAWKKRCPSATEKHHGQVKKKILKIYDDSYQNYGAPKIIREL